jgi:hypothetical protein
MLVDRLKEMAQNAVKDAAKEVMEKADDAPFHDYHVCYRIAEDTAENQTYSDRYTKLKSKLEQLQGAVVSHNFEDRSHVSTSVWLVKVRFGVDELYDHLFNKTLVKGYDVLEVTEVMINKRRISPKPTKAKSHKTN